jgi:alpha-glucosidase
MALVMLFTFVGTPCLYYGTEVGLEGDQDPDNRRCFPWERVASSKWLPFVKSLIQLRCENSELQRGSFEVLSHSDQHIVYVRRLGSKMMVVALGFSDVKVEVPVWKLGLETGAAISCLRQERRAINGGLLKLSLSAQQFQLMKLS